MVKICQVNIIHYQLDHLIWDGGSSSMDYLLVRTFFSYSLIHVLTLFSWCDGGGWILAGCKWFSLDNV